MSTQQILLGVGAGKKTYVEDVFSIDKYYADSGNYINVVNGIDLASNGGMVWGHRRDNAEDHCVCDTERGPLKYISWHDTNTEETSHGFSSYNSNGFTVNNTQRGAVNEGDASNYGGDFVTRTFRKAPGFFDVVKWDGNDTAGRQIAHNLGTYPGMMIVVPYSGGSKDRAVYHVSMGNTKHIILNGESGPVTLTNVWNNTSPTDTHFTVGTNGLVNESGRSYVCYLFGGASGTGTSHHVFGVDGDEDIIKCGSYTGNADSGTNGTFVNLGWEPQFVLVKRISGGNHGWFTIDAFRGQCFDGGDMEERLDQNAVESESTRVDFTSTGFRLRTSGSSWNGNSNEYFYMAIRRGDGIVGKPPDTATDVFNVSSPQSSGLPAFTNTGWDTDMAIYKQHTSTSNWLIGSRLWDKQRILANSTATMAGETNFTFDWTGGWNQVNPGSTYTSWQWKRHKGFTVMNWYGNSTTTGHIHKLGQIPEMAWIKCVSHGKDWVVGHHGMNGGTNPWNYYVKLNTTDSQIDDNAIFDDLAPTKTVFYTGNDDKVNASGLRYTAFLFSSVPGISKVGYYTGSGAMTVTTGFQPRFVLIKNISQSSNRQWLILDTSRGWGSGDDHYIVLNSTSQHYTHEFGAPTSTGFTLEDHIWVSTSGDNFIYYAHA